MDASDKIRKVQAQAIFTYYKQNTLSQQATCNYSTCSSITNCIVNYPSYAEKDQVNYGRQLCNNCSQIGCGCQS